MKKEILKNIICIPETDKQKRFLLGKRGKSMLLAVGLNPSTADENKLDPTSRNIETIAKLNGCDGWLLINLCPLRTSNPKKLPQKINIKLIYENEKFIRDVIQKDRFNITKILFCWGNYLERRSYLKKQSINILNLLENEKPIIYCLGKTRLGNPFHPSPMAINRFLGGLSKLRLKKMY